MSDTKERAPKILLCTVDTWKKDNATSTAFTLSELFKDFGSNNLAALYIREEAADSPVCSEYFRISEQSVIKSILKPKTVTGCRITSSNLSEVNDTQSVQASKKIYGKYGKKRNPILLMMRELLWFFGKWKSRELNEFLDDFSPDIVVFGIESYMHFNRINRYIVRRTGAKAIGCVWDDHISNYTSAGVSSKISRSLQRKSFKKTARCCDRIFSITPKTKKEVDEFLGVDSIIMTKPLSASALEWMPYTASDPINVLYTGNLQIGRLESLKLLAKALKEINAEKERIHVDVYTTTAVDEQDQAELSPYVSIHEPVTQSAVMQLQKKADVLLFIEDLSRKHRYDSRLSFSTKLTDYFSSGKCILAIAPPDISSIEYLKEQDAAICVSSEEELKEKLIKLVLDTELIAEYGRKAFLCGVNNHSREKLIGKINNIVKELMENDNEDSIG